MILRELFGSGHGGGANQRACRQGLGIIGPAMAAVPVCADGPRCSAASHGKGERALLQQRGAEAAAAAA